MDKQIVIFTHYGNTTYLKHTLTCAKITNPDARLILLGDELNHDIAVACGWEHHLFESLQSPNQIRFNKVFRHVQGRLHGHMRGGRDWLKYVFERWFYVDEFIRREKIRRFWHFDSDTMIVQELRTPSETLCNFDFSVQCNGTCLNGITNDNVVSEFTEHICSLFEDENFLAAQQLEFDSINPEYAFTEMRAFDDYKNRTAKKWIHLLYYDWNKIFDDCICQHHGFDLINLPSGEIVKNISFVKGKFIGTRLGEKVEFITLNLSWVPDYVFQWVLNSLAGKTAKPLASHCPYRLRIKNILKILKRKFIS